MTLPRALLVLGVLSTVLCTADHRPLPPVYTCEGTYYGCGHSIGTQAAKLMKARLSQPDVSEAAKVIGTTEGAKLLQQYKSRVENLWPHLAVEMQGLADGSNLSYDEVFLLNTWQSFVEFGHHHVFKSKKAMGCARCTAVYTNSKNTPCHGHNEDDHTFVVNTTYFVNATILNEKGEIIEKFTAFVYSGSMAGMFFGWNFHGLSFSAEFIFTKEQSFQGISANLIVRAAYGASSIDEVMVTLQSSDTTSGMAVDVGCTKVDPITHQYRIVSFEKAPMRFMAVNEIPSARAEKGINGTATAQTWYRHTNMFQITNTTSMFLSDPSSIARRQRIDEIAEEHGVPETPMDLRRFLGDTKDPIFPVYRNGSAADAHT